MERKIKKRAPHHLPPVIWAKVLGREMKINPGPLPGSTPNEKQHTMWVAAIDTLYPKGFNADSLRYVPFGNGTQFELRTGCDSSSKSGNKLYLFEAKTPYRTYLEGINKDELNNLIDLQLELGRYPGLKVGDAEVGNNNAGNWE